MALQYDPEDPDPNTPKKWIEPIRHNETQIIPITQEFEGVPKNLKGLKGIVLTGHQRRNIKAMMDLENIRRITVKSDVPYYTNKYIQTQAGRLSEKLGSGKTFIILGLILSNECPKIEPEVIRPKMYHTKNNVRKKILRNPNGFYGYGYNFERVFKTYLNTNIIFVSNSVLVQWENTIKKHLPKTKYMIIDNVLRLRTFETEVYNGTYNKEITVVKNGTSVISGLKSLKEYIKQYEAKNVIKVDNANNKAKDSSKNIKLPIITSIAHILDAKQLPCKRLFIDDFDTINMSRTAVIPTSLFYWVVSSTNKEPKYQSDFYTYDNVKDTLTKFHPMVSGITENILLHTSLNIACLPQYTDACVSLGNPIYILYEYDNPYDKVANVLGAYDLGNAQQVREAINADSPGDAAKLANIDSNDPLDMLERLLGNGKKQYLKACKTLKYIEKTREELPDLPAAKKNKYPKSDVKKLRKNIKAVVIKYNSPPIKDLLDTAYKNALDIKEKNGKALDRARESLSAENCTVCYDEMRECDIIMTKCCNSALCAPCGFHSTGIPTSHDLRGQCAKCRTPIGIRGLIFISKDFNLDKFIKKDAELEIEISEKSENKAEVIGAAEIPKTKRECILHLVQGKEVIGRQINVIIDKLLIGKDKLSEAPASSKRFLILSNYTEILHNLLADFDKNKIPALQLQGTSKQKDNIINEFRSHGKVLLINSEKDCAGLNLQFATDLIFCHKIFDHNVESQVAGRIQRMGCKYQVRIHYVLYKNEVGCLKLAK